MSLVVNHNLMAMNAARNLNSSYNKLSTSTRRLSSGLRVDTAADDAAGLAIRELMRAEISGMQRLLIESEYQQMASEITRIANATDFNGIKLLDGTLSGAHDGSGLVSKGELKIHFGTGNDSAEDYYYIQIGNCTASALGLGNASTLDAGHDISTQENAQKALEAITAAIVSKDNIRAHLGAIQNRLENTITNLSIQAENLQAAESRISDVDVATEMTNFVRNQILTQSAVAMLGQANSLPQMAMQLIGG